MNNGMRDIARLADELACFGPPIVVFNKSHSGSRLLAGVLTSAGVYLGANCNESEDSLDILRLVEHVVVRHYPNYSELFERGDPELVGLVRDVFCSHLAGLPAGARWGWKLCETTFALPLFAYLFPNGRFVHLLRDGRDVAFSDHVAPTTPFWRKVYFDSPAVTQWNARPLIEESYRLSPHVFNAQHWINSVRVGRAYGSMLGDRYREVRYEALCLDFVDTVTSLLAWLDLDAQEALEHWTPRIKSGSIGKYRSRSQREIAQATAVLDYWLISFGYANFSEVRSATRWWRHFQLR